MQLASKMRFVSVQLEALLDGDLWLRNGRARQRHGRAAARRRRGHPRRRMIQQPAGQRRLRRAAGRRRERLRKRFRFYFWDEAAGEVRWMCAFDTTEDDVDSFIAAIKRELAAA